MLLAVKINLKQLICIQYWDDDDGISQPESKWIACQTSFYIKNNNQKKSHSSHGKTITKISEKKQKPKEKHETANFIGLL